MWLQHRRCPPSLLGRRIYSGLRQRPSGQQRQGGLGHLLQRLEGPAIGDPGGNTGGVDGNLGRVEDLAQGALDMVGLEATARVQARCDPHAGDHPGVAGLLRVARDQELGPAERHDLLEGADAAVVEEQPAVPCHLCSVGAEIVGGPGERVVVCVTLLGEHAAVAWISEGEDQSVACLGECGLDLE